MDYKKVLVLSYFNTLQASYSYREISEIFGLNANQVNILIDQLYEEGFLELDGYYRLTSNAKRILEKYNLEEIDFFDSFEEESIFVNRPMGFDDIYLPIGFTKKVK
ncbi:hypothetical protein [Bacillus sp. 7894-2]|uniref:hypothetical protein n=1 Tax=Bacillus sp. 7894-2 TaxID=2021695 RepID=UPI000BA7A573|nr:hypothetical protein [Bacillus sp. 7894-2]PAE23882.1 hypothetical protein CHI10_15675 [Bacillus sp. 7894-2]